MTSFVRDKLKVCVYTTRKEMGYAAAKDISSKIKELLSRKEYINMIFAAAPSQNEVLEGLVNDTSIPWEMINAFHMDEYLGLSGDAPQRFSTFLKDRLFDKVSFRNVFLINPEAEVDEECSRYTALLELYPPDITVLGIGENGHIAFNDPHVAMFDDPVLVKSVELDEKCRQQQVNDGCFSSIDHVPQNALTLTIPAMSMSKYMFCVVPALTKAQAVRDTVLGPVSEACPASILRTHDSAVLYLDRDSASLLLKELENDHFD